MLNPFIKTIKFFSCIFFSLSMSYNLFLFISFLRQVPKKLNRGYVMLIILLKILFYPINNILTVLEMISNTTFFLYKLNYIPDIGRLFNKAIELRFNVKTLMAVGTCTIYIRFSYL